MFGGGGPLAGLRRRLTGKQGVGAVVGAPAAKVAAVAVAKAAQDSFSRPGHVWLICEPESASVVGRFGKEVDMDVGLLLARMDFLWMARILFL